MNDPISSLERQQQDKRSESDLKRLLCAKTIPTDLLNVGWYIGLYASTDSFISVKYWDGSRWNNTQNPESECDVYFEPKAKMKPFGI